ncbi:hypothetical protein Tco_1119079 [Tanacetum coccineum]
MGASDDWWDMGRLDGFGGIGGFSVRKLYDRAMTIVHEQHHNTIGPFEGTSHITVLLDRTDDRALRHRLLLLLLKKESEPLSTMFTKENGMQNGYNICHKTLMRLRQREVHDRLRNVTGTRGLCRCMRVLISRPW